MKRQVTSRKKEKAILSAENEIAINDFISMLWIEKGSMLIKKFFIQLRKLSLRNNILAITKHKQLHIFLNKS